LRAKNFKSSPRETGPEKAPKLEGGKRGGEKGGGITEKKRRIGKSIQERKRVRGRARRNSSPEKNPKPDKPQRRKGVLHGETLSERACDIVYQRFRVLPQKKLPTK